MAKEALFGTDVMLYPRVKQFDTANRILQRCGPSARMVAIERVCIDTISLTIEEVKWLKTLKSLLL